MDRHRFGYSPFGGPPMPYDRVNLAVVGGGIVGAWAAFMAQRADPNRRVALLDRGLVGSGASMYGGAIRLPYGSSPARRTMADRSEQLYRAFASPCEADLPGRDLTLYWVVENGSEDSLHRGSVHAGPTEVDSTETSRLIRRLSFLRVPSGGGVLRDTASAGSPGATAARLADAVRRKYGGWCQEGVEVTAIQEDLTQCSLSLSDGCKLNTDAVLCATGPWSGPVGTLTTRKVRVKKVTALHLDWPVRRDDPAVFFFDRDAYLLPDLHAGRWIFSFASETWDVRPDPAELALSREDRRKGEAILQAIAPKLVDRIVGARGFCDGYASDANPVADLQPNSRRCSIAHAGAGSGYRFAPAMAEAALETIVERVG